MSEDVLEAMVSSYMKIPMPQHAFIWQGGEPSLMGAGFFGKVVEFQKKYGNGRVVANGLQTNATLLNRELAEILSEYKFLVGVSLDGPAELHDVYRKDAGGNGTHERVVRGIELLKDNNIEFNALVLVSRANVGHAAGVYRYLLDQGISFHQYIPCVEPGADGGLAPFAVTGAEWGRFLCELFDEWYERDTGKVSIRLFDSILNLIADHNITNCDMGDNCCRYFVVEYNGDVYPCDFFVEEKLKTGNVMENGWREMQESKIYRSFGAGKSRWNKACNECEWLWICKGDCMKNRFLSVQGDTGKLSHLCAGWKMFYSHAMPAFMELARGIESERKARSVAAIKQAASMPGRNDPCPCGSGKKFKKCCGKIL